MIKYTEVEGHPRLAIVIPGICDMDRIEELRDALFDVVEVNLFDEECKEAVSSSSLFWVMTMIRELTHDLEGKVSIRRNGH